MFTVFYTNNFLNNIFFKNENVIYILYSGFHWIFLLSVLLFFRHAMYLSILGMGTEIRASRCNEVNQRRWHGSSDDNRYRDRYIYFINKLTPYRIAKNLFGNKSKVEHLNDRHIFHFYNFIESNIEFSFLNYFGQLFHFSELYL